MTCRKVSYGDDEKLNGRNKSLQTNSGLLWFAWPFERFRFLRKIQPVLMDYEDE